MSARSRDRPSSRHVAALFGGHTLAASKRPHMLLEAMMPKRYYLPREDVRTDLLVPSQRRSICAYKGRASYFSVEDSGAGGEDIAWTYEEPLRGYGSDRQQDLLLQRARRSPRGRPVDRAPGHSVVLTSVSTTSSAYLAREPTADSSRSGVLRMSWTLPRKALYANTARRREARGLRPLSRSRAAT